PAAAVHKSGGAEHGSSPGALCARPECMLPAPSARCSSSFHGRSPTRRAVHLLKIIWTYRIQMPMA
ncbi:hypothetical protein NDU88_001667, partial [Pleurodeles waltl]